MTEEKIIVIVQLKIVGKVAIQNLQELVQKLKFSLQRKHQNHQLQANTKDRNSLKTKKVVANMKKINNLTHNILLKIKIFLVDSASNQYLHKRKAIKYTSRKI